MDTHKLVIIHQNQTIDYLGDIASNNTHSEEHQKQLVIFLLY